jgi:hypothetical protein
MKDPTPPLYGSFKSLLARNHFRTKQRGRRGGMERTKFRIMSAASTPPSLLKEMSTLIDVGPCVSLMIGIVAESSTSRYTSSVLEEEEEFKDKNKIREREKERVRKKR